MTRLRAGDVPGGTVVKHDGYWGVLGRWAGGARAFNAWDREGYWIDRDSLVNVPTNRTSDTQGHDSRVAHSARPDSDARQAQEVP